MNPKKPKIIYNIVSETLNIKPELIEVLVEFYYQNVRTLISNLEYPRINIDGLGHFFVKPIYVSKSKEKIIKILDDHDTSTFKAYHNKKAMETKLDNLIKLEKKLLEQQIKKINFIKDKNEKYT